MSRFKVFWLFMACAYWPCFFISLQSGWGELSLEGVNGEETFRVLVLYALALIATRPQFKCGLEQLPSPQAKHEQT